MSLLRDWNRFWFKRTTCDAVGIMRILFGLLVLAAALQLWPDRFVWFSDHGLLPWQAAMKYNNIYTPMFNEVPAPAHLYPGWRPINFMQYFTDDWEISAFFIVYMLAAVSMTLGFCTRTSIFLVWLGLMCIHDRDSLNNTTGGDEIMIITIMYLFMANSGGALSVDRLIRLWRGKEDPNRPPEMWIWPQRLMQIQVAVVYMATFMNKTLGQMWQNGTAVYVPYQTLEFHRFAVPFMDHNFGNHFPFAFLNDNNPGIIAIMTYGTLAVEIALGTLIWVPRLRLYVLAAGVMLHLGIEYAMNIPLFAFLMISSYVAFLRPEDLRNFCAWLTRTFRLGKLRVVYDGECGFCRSTALLLRSTDTLRLLRFLDYHNPEQMQEVPTVNFEDADQAVITVASPWRRTRRRRAVVDDAWPPVTGSDHRDSGFYAFRQIAKRMPVLWPILPFMYLLPWPGIAAYAWVAGNRRNLPVAPAVVNAPPAPSPRSTGRRKAATRR